MASFGDFLVVTIIILAVTIPLVAVAGYAMFGINASARGFDTSLDYNEDGCFEKYNDLGLVYSEFCKSDYGFLGWRGWVTQEDEDFIKNTITEIVDGDIKTDCLYGLDTFKMTEQGDKTVFEYSCNVP